MASVRGNSSSHISRSLLHSSGQAYTYSRTQQTKKRKFVQIVDLGETFPSSGFGNDVIDCTVLSCARASKITILLTGIESCARRKFWISARKCDRSAGEV